MGKSGTLLVQILHEQAYINDRSHGIAIFHFSSIEVENCQALFNSTRFFKEIKFAQLLPKTKWELSLKNSF